MDFGRDAFPKYLDEPGRPVGDFSQLDTLGWKYFQVLFLYLKESETWWRKDPGVETNKISGQIHIHTFYKRARKQIWIFRKFVQKCHKMAQNGPKLPHMAQKWRPDLHTFSAIFFTEKAVPRTFLLLECMLRCYSSNLMRFENKDSGDLMIIVQRS